MLLQGGYPYTAVLTVVALSVVGLPQGRSQEPRVAITPRAQSGSAQKASSNIRVNTDLVLVPVLVTDSEDRAVTGLNREQFKLFEDKIEQPITHFASEDSPISVGIVFDGSGSMGAKLQKAKAAVTQFLSTSNPDDEFFLVKFSDRAELVVDLTRESGEIQNRLSFTRSRGRTALLDAIYLAMVQMKHAHNPRKALVLISDGGDNSSRYTMGDIKNQIREADVQIYSMGIFEPLYRDGLSPEELAGPGLLNNISRQSGGRFFNVADLNDLPEIASKIGSALRNQYVIGFSPAAPTRDGKYHRITVKLVHPKGVPPLRAFFRRGYVSPVSAPQ